MYKINIRAINDASSDETPRKRAFSMSSNSSPSNKAILKSQSPTTKLPILLSPITSQARIKGSHSPCSPGPISQSKVLGGQFINKAFTPTFKMPKLQKAVCSLKCNGLIKAYAANTCIGIVRSYNEDRISISSRISKPRTKQVDAWPVASWYGLFDGHGGSQCADFLRDNLLRIVINQESYPANPRTALVEGFREAEACFLAHATSAPEQVDRSGSCAIVVLVVGSKVYVANVGDSRAVLSMDRGMHHEDLSSDQKPNDPNERSRIYSHGGEVYFRKGSTFSSYASGENEDLIIHRVLPGRLSVSRTFGDVDAKLPHLGGKRGVVVAEPEIRIFDIQDNFDFIVMGCDGIYDKLTSSDVVRTCWSTVRERSDGSFHTNCGMMASSLLIRSMKALSTDNVTAMVIAFNGLQSAFNETPGHS